MQFFAHTANDRAGNRLDVSKWQPLAEHLVAVAESARAFAKEARPDDEILAADAFAAGLLHDVGKYRPEFQLLLQGQHRKNERTRHKQFGAIRANNSGRPDIAFAIAGHHGGIPDRDELKLLVKDPETQNSLEHLGDAPEQDCPQLFRLALATVSSNDALTLEFRTRLLFSCLVDADWQDTDAFHRRTVGLPLDPSPVALDPVIRLAGVKTYIAGRQGQCRDRKIAVIRHTVMQAALAAAEFPPGLFSMTVPTGGGKTLSALAFALAHAARHGLRRIIYVAPYLSIIEQNAREIRRAIGADDSNDIVFEHHSLAEPAGGASADEAETNDFARRAENWSQPFVVTTSVQFFESLFSNRPGQVRKLHNIARSVVILDECQTVAARPDRADLLHAGSVSGNDRIEHCPLHCDPARLEATPRIARGFS